MAFRSSTNLLKKVDFPTLGLPTIATMFDIFLYFIGRNQIFSIYFYFSSSCPLPLRESPEKSFCQRSVLVLPLLECLLFSVLFLPGQSRCLFGFPFPHRFQHGCV